MKKVNPALLGTALCAVIIATAPGLRAQTSNADGDQVLEPIVVTASKLEKSVSEIPGTVKVITGQELKDAGVDTLLELDRVVPGLQIHRQGSDAFTSLSMRGVFSADFYNPSVVVYVDGVALDQAFVDVPLLDVERVEVLKGPQGSLYGENAHAGVINIVTRAPDNSTQGYVKGRLSQLGDQIETGLSTSLVEDILYGSVNFSGMTESGEIDNTQTGEEGVDDSRSRHANAKLRYAPTGGPLDATLNLSYDRDVAEGAYLSEANWKDKKITSSSLIDRTDREAVGASLNLDYTFDDFKLTSISRGQKRDMDRVLVARQNEDQGSVSQEIRLAYDPVGSVFSAVFGGYTKKTSYDRDAVSFFSNNSYIVDVEMETYAIFGEASYDVTDRLNITGGARYAIDESDFKFNETGGLSMQENDSWSAWTPKVGGVYQWTDNLGQFVNISRGYKPGGFNRTATNSAASVAYDPEYSWSYETGLRGDFLDSRLQLEAAVYHIDISDMQLYTGVGGQQVLRNTGDAASDGVELSASAMVSDDLQINAALEFNRSEFDTTDATDGNTTPYAPGVTANTAIQYYWDVEGVPGLIIPRLDVTYYGKSYFDVSNTYSQNEYTVVDLRLGYEWNDLTVTLFVENLFDKAYKTFQSSASTVQAGAGRNAGVQVNFKF